MTTRSLAILTVLLAVVLGTLAVPSAGAAARGTPQAAASTSAPETKTGEVHRPPLAPRDRMGIYVFLAWLWMSIIILIFFLRDKIRESDRVFRAGLYQTPEITREPRRR